MKIFKKKKKSLKVILWSYGCEGKSTLLYQLFKEMKNFQLIYTVGINVETINFNNIEITFWEISGACKIKDLRNNYCTSSDAIIYLIDSSCLIKNDISYDYKDNFEELKKCIKILDDKPLLLAITKIDIRKLSTLDLINAYELDKLLNGNEKFGIIECSSFTMEGIKEILFWLSSLVK